MEGLQIPERYHSGIIILATISNEVADEFLNALRRASPSLYTQRMALEVSEDVKTLSPEEILATLNSVVSLFEFRERSGSSVEDLVKQVSLAIEEDKDIDGFSGEQKSAFEKHLTSFLELDDILGTTAKAIGVIRDHERLYVHSRVLTDIRPVFLPDVSKGLAGVVSVNMLKIEYRDLDGEKEFFVAMDSYDMDDLLEQLVRAREKSKALRSKFESLNIPFLDDE